jgi:glycosyltransferase involved in cell wall biosynthesis
VTGRATGRLRIAMVGQRGVPATFGGVERHVEELGARLVDRGHEVVVYCRTNYGEDVDRTSHRGISLEYFDTVNSKHFDAIAHSSRASVAAMSRGVDIVHYHALGPGLVSPLPRYLSRARVVQTIHGLDQDRAKWGQVASRALRLGCWMSARVPDATVVVSRALQEHYRAVYGRASSYIPNGVAIGRSVPAGEVLSRHGLTAGRYLLFVGRLVPEKAPDMLLRAFRDVPGDMRLAVVGGSSFTPEYVAELDQLAAADPRVEMTGYLYGEELDEVYSNAAGFVLPSMLEGMPLTLLEAAAHGRPLLVSDIPPHVEVLDHDEPGRRFFRHGEVDDLRDKLVELIAHLPAESVGARQTQQWIGREYNWDRATDQLLEVYRQVLRGVRPAPQQHDDLAATRRLRAPAAVPADSAAAVTAHSMSPVVGAPTTDHEKAS